MTLEVAGVFKLSGSIISVARDFPLLTKGVLWLWSRVHISVSRLTKRYQIPWLFTELGNAVGYRVPVMTTLANGMKVIVPWNDDGGQAIYNGGYYEPTTVNLIEKLLKPGMVFFDIGANIGQYSLVASDRIGPSGEVHSFEPDPVTFEWLSRNARLNNLSRIYLNQVALFNEAGPRQLYLATPRDTGSNSFAIPWTFSGRTCDVACTTLEEYVREKNITRVDVMKIDVEGSELFVLKGGSTILDHHTKPILVIEFEEEMQGKFGTSCAKLAEFLTAKGYELFRCGTSPLTKYEPGPENPFSLNVLAIPKGSTDPVLELLR
jgi:FkbM family methyltransferase